MSAQHGFRSIVAKSRSCRRQGGDFLAEVVEVADQVFGVGARHMST
jgi:hypothetical protein